MILDWAKEQDDEAVVLPFSAVLESKVSTSHII